MIWCDHSSEWVTFNILLLYEKPPASKHIFSLDYPNISTRNTHKQNVFNLCWSNWCILPFASFPPLVIFSDVHALLLLLSTFSPKKQIRNNVLRLLTCIVNFTCNFEPHTMTKRHAFNAHRIYRQDIRFKCFSLRFTCT